jgi:hypothetical protein
MVYIQEKRREKMSYSDNYTLTKVYWKNYVAMYMDVYAEVYNKMKDLYDDEAPLAAAVHTAMIAFSKGSGMDMAGVITWDEKLADQEGFVMFADPKVHTGYAQSPQKTFGGSGGYQKPASGGYQKKPYDGPTELKGPASEKQVNKIHELLNDNDPKVQKVVSDALSALNVAAPEELTKQDAHDIIDAGFKASPKKTYYKK